MQYIPDVGEKLCWRLFDCTRSFCNFIRWHVQVNIVNRNLNNYAAANISPVNEFLEILLLLWLTYSGVAFFKFTMQII